MTSLTFKHGDNRGICLKVNKSLVLERNRPAEQQYNTSIRLYYRERIEYGNGLMTELASGATTVLETIKPLTMPIRRAIRPSGRKYYVLKIFIGFDRILSETERVSQWF